MFFVYNESRPCRFSFKLVFVDLMIKESTGPFLWKRKKGVSEFKKRTLQHQKYRAKLTNVIINFICNLSYKTQLAGPACFIGTSSANCCISIFLVLRQIAIANEHDQSG